MSNPRRTIHIDRYTESLSQKDEAIWWDQRGVIYNELKSGKGVNSKRYQQQLTDLNSSLLEEGPEYINRQHKVIFLHGNAPSHTKKLVRDTLKAVSWEVVPLRLIHQTWLLPITTCLH